jgi:Cu/Ag efflux pump CusA
VIRDDHGQLTGYVYIDLNTTDYGGFVDQASRRLREKLQLPTGYTYQWSGECEFQLRANERLKIILPVVFFVIFLLLYMVFHSLTEAMVLIFPTFYAMTGGLILQWLLGYNFSVAVWVGYIALFGIAVETGVVMIVYLHEALDKRLTSGRPLSNADIEEAAIEGCRATASAKAHDGLCRSRQLDSDPLDKWHRFGRDEAHCRSHGWGNDYFNDSRFDSGSGFLRADEGASLATRDVAASGRK